MPVNDLTLTVGADNKNLKKGVNESKNSIKRFGKAIQTALGFGIHNVISRTVGLIKTMAVEAVKAHAQFERIELTLKKLLQSDIGGSALMSQLREFSVKTPFTPEDVFKSSRMLLSFGFTAREQVKNLKMLGDVASVSGKPLEELAFIYGKVFSRGRAQAREMNQMIRAQIPIVREVAKVMGVSETKVADLTREGKVSFEIVAKALQNLTSEGGQFFNMTEESSKTLQGRFSTLVGVVKELGDAFAGIFGKDLMGALNAAITILEDMALIMKGFGELRKENQSDIWGIPTLDAAFNSQDTAEADKAFFKTERGIKMLRENVKKAQEEHARLKKERMTLIPEEDGPGSIKNKNTLDSFFQKGIFLVDPSNIGSLDIGTQQLNVMQSMDTKLETIANNVESADANINNRANVKAIREGVGV